MQFTGHADSVTFGQENARSTTENMSGWVTLGTQAIIRLNGVNAGSSSRIKTESDGYFSGNIQIPDDPVNSLMTVELLSSSEKY